MTQNSIFFEHIRHVLGDETSPGMSEGEYLRLAADWFSAAHAWQFLTRPCFLDLRGAISFTTGSYVHATRTITKASAFTDYTKVPGDRFVATGGTGVELKSYTIESRPTASTLVLKAPGLGAAADAIANLAGNLPNDSIALPSDFMAFPGQRPLRSSGDIIRSIEFTSRDVLVARRSATVEVDAGCTFLGVVTELVNEETGNTEPVLEIFPGVSANVKDALRGYYRARLVIDPTDDQAVVPLPVNRPALELALIKACRAFALGLEEGEEVGKPQLEALLAQLVASSIWSAARKQDGLQMPTLGPLRGGVGDRGGYFKRALASEVEGPTAIPWALSGEDVGWCS